ncbi:MAG: hypothetical protein H6707_04710 [Deltaproteobacteria bacterium]|nr:hypothetical protein [Deltaproteobacteria bacterium]
MKRGMLTVALSLALTSSASAGDPCPIGFTVIDVGPPPWATETPHGQASLDRLLALAKKNPCTQIASGKIKNGQLVVSYGTVEDKDDIALSTVHRGFFGKNRRFLCEAQAKPLKRLKHANGDALLLYLRGQKRTQIALAGWSAICLRNDTFDKASDKQLRQIWHRLTRAYVADRHANP